MELTDQKLAKHIDHTLLKPEASELEIKQLCEEAENFGFFSVCVNPMYLDRVVEKLKRTKIKICTVIGFPLGANTPEVKAFEANDAILRGAQELDMVMNIGALKSGNLSLVSEDIEGVVSSARRRSVLVKVIVETSLLNNEEKRIACRICERAGADFVKTSTGWGTRGATIEDVKLLRAAVSPQIGVKASGGIRTASKAIALIAAGANRIGTSSGVKIMAELGSRK